MKILEFFTRNKTCRHSKVPPDSEYSYCPDCGKLVENQWYILRCPCCGIKRSGYIKNGNIMPEKPFCHNCGTNEYIIEKIDKINFINIDYAVLVKTVVENNSYSQTQSWVDAKTQNCKQRLLLQFL